MPFLVLTARADEGLRVRLLRDGETVSDQRLSRETVRRIGRFALPHRALIAGFLVFVVLDAALVVVNPLLIKHLLDDGVIAGDASVVAWLALAMAATSICPVPSIASIRLRPIHPTPRKPSRGLFVMVR